MNQIQPIAAASWEKMSLAAFESAGEAIVVTDIAGTIQYVNPAFEKISGYCRAEAIGLNPRVLKSGHHPPAFYQRLWQTISGGQTWRGAFINRRKDGQIYRSEQTIAPMIDADGHVTGYVSIHEDVTERVRDEQQRHDSELQIIQQAADEKMRLVRNELELAREVQRRLFPQAPIALPGVDIAGAAFPAEETCGDYYDFIPLPDGRLGIVLGDVSGHGLGPALIMSETRACLRVLLQSVSEVDEVLCRLNRLLVHDLESGRFVTLFFGILDPPSRSLVYATAGQPAYLFDAAGQITRLDNSGMVLGLLDDAEIPRGERIQLRPGDLLFLATDGLHETHARDGSMLGLSRTLELVQAHRHEEAHTLINELYASACQFRQGDPQQDDITMVVIRVPLAPNESTQCGYKM